jgi:cell division transport system permease protein
MRAMRYFFGEAAESLLRGWRPAAFSMLTIAAGLFVLGFFLLVNANLQRLVGRWSDSADLAVYLRDDASPEQVSAINEMVTRSGLAASVQQLTKEDARKEFARTFPDLAGTAAGLDRNPFPASLEVRLNNQAQSTPAAVDTFVTAVSGMAGVADVRYDRRWLARLTAVVRVVRSVGILIVTLLAVASALTVASVVRLAAAARRDEIEIMQLVGAPVAYIRGPFIAEGLLQGGIGAILAVLLLLGAFAVMRARVGTALTEAIGLTGLSFVPVELLILLVLGGMTLGSLGGFIVARSVR